MANQEQLAILKQGVQAWNEWRAKNLDVVLDLSEAILSGVDLRQANLTRADLTRANLKGADLKAAELTEADLTEADLVGAYLRGANLSHADLRRADLSEAHLIRTHLRRADLSSAHLNKADLTGADLKATDLTRVDFRRTDLSNADLSEADLGSAVFRAAYLRGSKFLGTTIGGTIFEVTDMSDVLGLENIVHRGPSSISTDTLALSRGKIPEIFLRGCGLSDWEIEEINLYNPALSNGEVNEILYKIYDLRATQALQISPLFISYSHRDSKFVDMLETHLNKKGIRFWRDIHDMKSGRIEAQIDRAIRQNPTVVLVLSENAISSDWVEHEARTARELEKEMERDVLCPVSLDDSWKDSRWPKRVMEQITEYNIVDFSAWQDDSKFDGMFRKLIDGLELFYKG